MIYQIKSKFLYLSICLILSFIASSSHANKLIKENDTFPNFDLSVLGQNSTKVNLAKVLKEKPKLVILDFWASWCGPCAEAMPVLEELNKKYQAKGLKVIGVNVDDEIKDGEDFAKKINISFPLIYDSKQSLSKKIKVKTMPSSYILNSKGKVVHVHKGFREGDKEKYEKIIKKYIR